MKRLLVFISIAVLFMSCLSPKPVETNMKDRYLEDGTRLLNLCECMTVSNGDTMCAIAEAVHPTDGSIIQWLEQCTAEEGRKVADGCALIGVDDETGTYVFGGFVTSEMCTDILNEAMWRGDIDQIRDYSECRKM